MKTLLERAKKLPATRSAQIITKEDIDLALAWARGEVRLKQVASVMPHKSISNPQVYIFLARALKAYFQKPI